jgi:predicted membrane GTPase involved in stress response
MSPDKIRNIAIIAHVDRSAYEKTQVFSSHRAAIELPARAALSFEEVRP